MLSRLLPLLFAATGVAGAVPTSPEGFWPLPLPTWLADRDPPDGVQITSVRPDMPASALHVQPGSILLEMAGMHPLDSAEVSIAVRIAGQRAANQARFGSDGRTMALRAPAFSAWTRWGIDTDSIRPPARMPGLDPAQDRIWNSLPTRVRLACRLAVGDGQVPAWLPRLLAIRAAAGGDGPAAGPAEMPTPYLARVSAWWITCSAAAPPPVDDPDEALFRAAHLPWPLDEPPGKDAIATGDAAADALLLALARSEPPSVDARTSAGYRLVERPQPGFPGDAGSYVGQCLAAVVDPDRHGGWPYRSGLIWQQPGRSQVVAQLVAASADPARAQLAALGRIGPAVIDQDAAALRDALGILQRGSPWLARQALRTSLHAAAMHRHLPWLGTALLDAPQPAVGRRIQTQIRWLIDHPGTDIDELFERQSPPALSLLERTWTGAATWREVQSDARQPAAALGQLLWGLATDPTTPDAESCPELARQLMLVCPEGTNAAQADMIAVALARCGRLLDAVAWESAAIAKAGSERLPEERRRRLVQDLTAHLATIRRNSPVSSGDPAPSTEVRSKTADGGLRVGRVSGGAACGIWRSTDGAGVVREETGFRAGEPFGRWTLRSADGATTTSGWFARGARVGWWVQRTADGGMATGWYDGAGLGSRCGGWSVYTPDGRLARHGPCRGGRPVAPWTKVAADGRMSAIAPSEVVLPDEPALPAAPELGELGNPAGF